MITVRPAEVWEMEDILQWRAACCNEVWTATDESGRMIAMCGYVPVQDRTFAFLEYVYPRYGASVVRAMRHGLRSHGKTIYVQCDDRHQTAARLLKILGFTPTDEEMTDARQDGATLRVWKWQSSQQ